MVRGGGRYPGVAIAAQLMSSIVLFANIFGTAVILLQKHKAGVRISRKCYREAIQGWRRLWPQRHRAGWAITYSLPALMVSAALYMISDDEIFLGDWLSCGFLGLGALYVFFVVGTMESEFEMAAEGDRDIVGMLAWTVSTLDFHCL